MNLNDWDTTLQGQAKEYIVAQFTKKTLHPRGSKNTSPVPRQRTGSKSVKSTSKEDDDEYLIFIHHIIC